jgi:hypothetical protein
MWVCVFNECNLIGYQDKTLRLNIFWSGLHFTVPIALNNISWSLDGSLILPFPALDWFIRDRDLLSTIYLPFISVVCHQSWLSSSVCDRDSVESTFCSTVMVYSMLHEDQTFYQRLSTLPQYVWIVWLAGHQKYVFEDIFIFHLTN